MRDMLGNVLNVGDEILFIDTESKTFTSATIKRFTATRCYFENHNRFASQDAFRAIDSVISLTALNAKMNTFWHGGEYGKDVLDHDVNIGDIVLFIDPICKRFAKGTITHLANQQCFLEYPYGWDDTIQNTKRFYSDIISLTAIHHEDCIPNNQSYYKNKSKYNF